MRDTTARDAGEELVHDVAEAMRRYRDTSEQLYDEYPTMEGCARAALAAMPAPGDTLEGLLGDAWEIAQARRDDSGRWIVAVWRLPYSPRQLIRDGSYGIGPTITDAVRMAIEAAGEGQ